MGKHTRGALERNRNIDQPSKYPFEIKVDVQDPSSVTAYLAKFNARMSDLETGLAVNGLHPGMAGYEDEQDGGEGYSVPSPGPDAMKKVY